MMHAVRTIPNITMKISYSENLFAIAITVATKNAVAHTITIYNN
jgi:hypothetical protein